MLRRSAILAAALAALVALSPAAQPPETPRRTYTTQIGLELRLVPVTSTADSIGLALRDYADAATGISEDLQQRLKQNGFRILSIPVEKLPNAMASLKPIGAIQTEWIGTLYRWAPLVTGPTVDAEYTQLDSGPLEVPKGRYRLLARCWVVPDLTNTRNTGSVDANLRVELLPQHQPTRRRDLERLLDPTPPSLEDEGMLFARLQITSDLGPQNALVIVPDDPGADWSKLKATEQDHSIPVAPTSHDQIGPSPQETEPPMSMGDQAAIPTAPAPVVLPGPVSPSFRTIGEQLLRRPAEVIETPGPNSAPRIEPERSLVVVLIPHVPNHYALLP